MMDFKNDIINENLFELVKKYIDDLYDVKMQLKNVFMTCNLDNNLDMKKKSSTLQFKLKNYNRWKLLVNNCSKDDFKNKSIINKTISSKSLLKKIEEINDNNTLIEIDETKNLIETLESKISNDFTTKKINKNKGFFKNKNKTSTYKNVDLYNLQRVNGIGEKTAQKYLDKNIKLENFLEEWESEFKSDNHSLVSDKYINITSNTNLSNYSSERQSFIENKFKHTKYLKYLKHSQLIGIKYLHDIEKRIPRDEIKSMERVMKTVLKQMNKDIIIEVCGSYRRGNKDSGDIDILLSHPLILKDDDIKRMRQNILLKLVILLQEIGFLYDHITVDGNTKYMGMCKLNHNKPYRRIDVRFISYESFPTALLYFTGSADLNTKMRIEAKSKGYKLNEYGLYKSEFDKKTNEYIYREKFDTPDEESVFKILGMKYLIPTERNIK
jgi:DNA polymerase beta